MTDFRDKTRTPARTGPEEYAAQLTQQYHHENTLQSKGVQVDYEIDRDKEVEALRGG